MIASLTYFTKKRVVCALVMVLQPDMKDGLDRERRRNRISVKRQGYLDEQSRHILRCWSLSVDPKRMQSDRRQDGVVLSV